MNHRYDPELYALIHRGTPGDKGFYARVFRDGGSVLELGCGYGRLIPSLVKTGARYRGLEQDLGLLQLARRARRDLDSALRARVRLGHGDMRDFVLRERFDRILIPHSALYCLASDRDVLRCLTRVREHLRPDGELVLDCYAADGFHHRLDATSLSGSERDLLTKVEHEGVCYRVFESTRWEPRAQRLWVRYDYESEHKPSVVGRIRHRYLLREQLERLLAKARLQVVELSGGYAGERFNRRSEQLVLRAKALK